MVSNPNTWKSLERQGYIVLCQNRVSTRRLAEALSVSAATAQARVVAALRARGVDIVSVRENGRWHYEVRNQAELAAAGWQRLKAAAGFAKGWRTFPGKGEDDI